MKTIQIILLVITMNALSCYAQRKDIILADFEGADYGAWITTGNAFGKSPVHGPSGTQMPVSGFLGHGLVSSFNGGDESTGTLTSPDFILKRKLITFNIGGGGFAGSTCMNLIVDGKIVRTSIGPNTKEGGSEVLSQASWDISGIQGKTAQLQIVDHATGGWGHINVDQIVQSDQPVPAITTLHRNLTVTKRFLYFPVKYTQASGGKNRVQVIVDGAIVREFDMDLSETPDWYAHLDMSAWKNKKATLKVMNILNDSKVLKLVTQGDRVWNADKLYSEPLRAQLHFSPGCGWNNDPNGLVYADGEYHMYYQHNPYSWEWGNMSWGHATSTDMVHWVEQPIAIYPYKYGDTAFSGGAVVDINNTSGLKKGKNSLIVATYTSTGRGQCLVYSNDKGRTFREYSGNPVITKAVRDPRPIWYEPGKHWVVTVYDEVGADKYINFFTSPDLKTWTYQSRVKGFYECPDLFELQSGDKKEWILTGASSDYMVGQFDGKVFTPHTSMLKGHLGKGFYAAQTFTNEPKGRVVQIGWMQTRTLNMPFNQGMSLPNELKLIQTTDGPRLTWTPVPELNTLRKKTYSTGSITLTPGDINPLSKITGELLELRADFIPEANTTTLFTVRGVVISYTAATEQLSVNGLDVHAPLVNGHQKIIVYADRTSLEVYASDGLVYVPMPVFPKEENRSVTVNVTGGPVRFNALDAYQLKSIWSVPSLHSKKNKTVVVRH